MALSRSERRRLAEIERELSAEAPRLARRLARGPARHRKWRRWQPWELAASAAMSVAEALAGVALIGTRVGGVLIACGTLGLLAALAAGAWELRHA